MRFEASLTLLSGESAAAILAALIAMWYLARASRDKLTRWLSLVLCLLMVAVAFNIAPDGVPLWLRAGVIAVLSIPLAIWT